MADPKKILGGLGKVGKRLVETPDEARLRELLSHSGDKALPLRLPRANLSDEFINQQAERVARQMMGEHVTSGKAGDTANLAGRSMKESQRVKGLDYKLSPTGTVAPETPYTPRKGDVKVAFPGDQTVSNKILEEVEGFPIDSVQEGGAYYGLGQKHLKDPEFWKSTETPAKNVQAKVNRVSELYEPERVIGSHLAMGPMSNNFAMHFADANLRAIDWSKAQPSKINQFDRLIAKGYFDPVAKKWVTFPDWPGLADREAALAAMKENTALRKWVNNRFKTPAVTEPLGLPNGLDIQYAITEPRIRDMEINMTGLMTGELQPNALVEAAGAPHNTYSHRILGEAGGPQEVLTPFVLDFPDAAQHIASTKRPSDFTGTIQKVFPHQVVDDQYINQYNQYRDRLKELTNQKKGGAINIDEADKRLAKAIENRMAKGGGVDLEAADARLSAAIEARMADGGKVAKGAVKAFKKLFADDVVNGMRVRQDIPNQSSIGASLTDYSTHGLQEVPMSAFETVGKPRYRSVQEEKRTRELARQIQENKELNPLIVVKDAEGHYILEGGHRFDALRELGIDSFPALMVHDLESLGTVAKADGGKLVKGAAKVFKKLFANDVLPAAEREVNLQKFIAPSAEKRRMYHGSKEPNIKEFKTRKEMTDDSMMTGHYADERDAVFLSPEPDFTKNFSQMGYTDTHQAPTTYPVYVQVEKPFDFDNPEHLKQVKETYKDMFHNPDSEFYESHISPSERSMNLHTFNKRVDSLPSDENNWARIENQDFQDVLKDLGFDSFYTRERGTKNLGVYEPNRIKSAIGNRGTYDLGDPDINKAQGGLAMADGGKLIKGLGKIGKRLMADPEAVTPSISGGTRKFGNDASGLNIIKGTGGNWIGGDSSGSTLGNVDRNLQIKRPYSNPELRVARGKEKIANLESRGELSEKHQNLLNSHRKDLAEAEKMLAVNNWITKNIGNYIKKDMATANDPVRLMFEKRAQEIEQQFTVDMNRAQRTRERAEAEVDPRRKGNMMRQATEQEQQATLDREFAMQHSTHLPKGENNWGDVDAEALSQLKQQRQQAGFPPEGVAKSEPAKQWERISDEAITSTPAGDIQKQKGALEELRLAEEAHKQKWADIDKRYYESIKKEFGDKNVGMSDEQIRRYADLQPITDKAKYLGEDAELEKMSRNMFEKRQNSNQGFGMIGDQNQWINKLDPEAKVNSAYIGDLGIDHIIDVIKQDVLDGRIRPEQLNKLSMEQAVKRVADYNMERAKIMQETGLKQAEGFPTHKEYADKGYKWIELKVPDYNSLPLEERKQMIARLTEEARQKGLTPEDYIEKYPENQLAEALKYEGDTMGHCVGNYCPDVSSGKSRIYSLRDKRGEPHVTIEVIPGEITPLDLPKDLYEEYRNQMAQGISAHGGRPGATEWLKHFHPDVAEQIIPPESIKQIKGKQNAAPKEDYLPFVQDFVKSGEWSGVGDLKNTGLIHREGKYLTPAEDTDWLLKELGLPPTPPPEGMAEGGGAFKKISFYGGGGLTTSGGSFSPEELGVGASELPPDVTFADMAKYAKRIGKNAVDLLGEGKESLSETYDRVKDSPRARAQLAKVVALQTAGGANDFAHMVVDPLAEYVLDPIKSKTIDKVLTKPKYRSVLAPKLKKGEKEEREPIFGSISNALMTDDGYPIGGSEHMIKRAQQAGLMFGRDYPILNEDGSYAIDPETNQPYQSRSGRFNLLTEIGGGILGGLGLSKLGKVAKKGYVKNIEPRVDPAGALTRAINLDYPDADFNQNYLRAR